jgi:pimeloyl-ACP methyl ester carboxylesterase
MTPAAPVTSGYVNVNGVNIAFDVQGQGPSLVLIMGYRLHSIARPQAFIDVLKRSFTVITLDNRGTGRSDKPLTGYSLANMARDVATLLDEVSIESSYVLGYSMGGAIAQEFVRQFPHRVNGLILCATMCGGPHATYARPSIVRVMRDLDGLSTEQIARRIWQVTYAPHYLEQN